MTTTFLRRALRALALAGLAAAPLGLLSASPPAPGSPPAAQGAAGAGASAQPARARQGRVPARFRRVRASVQRDTVRAPRPARRASAGLVWRGLHTPSVGTADAAFNAAVAEVAGANVVRFPFDWRWAEPRKGEYNLARYDAIYSAMVARGRRPLIELVFAPSWATDGLCDQQVSDCRYGPTSRHYADAGRTAAMVARRYPEAVAIEVWNEPNLTTFWRQGPDPAAYTALLKAVYQAVKAANPAIAVVSGGLSPAAPAVAGIPVREFLRGMYKAGAKRWMDGIGIHPYPWVAGLSNFYKALDDVRDVRDANADSTRPLWATELGITTSGPYGVDEGTQAHVLGALHRSLGLSGDVRANVVHAAFDTWGAPDSGETGYGILRRDGGLKPAFCAVTKAFGGTFVCDTAGWDPVPPTTLEEGWSAQDLLHMAWDAARRYYAGSKTGFASFDNAAMARYEPRLSSVPAPDPAYTGSGADPRRIAIYRSSNQAEVLLCNASRGDMAYCIHAVRPDQITYGRGVGSIAWAAQQIVYQRDTRW